MAATSTSTTTPRRVVAALMAMIHRGASGDEAWDIYQQWLSRRPTCSASMPATPSSRRCCSTPPAASSRRSGVDGASVDAGARPCRARPRRAVGERRGGDPRLPRQGRRRRRRRSRRSAAPATATASICSTAAGDAAARHPVARQPRRGARRRTRRRRQRRAPARASACRRPGRRRRRRCSPGSSATAPEIYARAGTVFFCKDFVTFRLTGRACQRHLRHVAAPACCACPERRYDDDCWRSTASPTPRPAAATCSSRPTSSGGSRAEAAAATGLAEGTPVVAGLFDVVACALGSGAVGAGAGLDHRRHLEHQPGVLAPRRSSIRRVFMVVGASAADRVRRRSKSAPPPPPTSNGMCASWSSAAATTTIRSAPATTLVAARHARRRRSRSSTPSSTARGSARTMRAGFYGLAGWHGEGHMLRALFEGVVFEHRRHIDVLRAAGRPLRQRRRCRAAARAARIWPQMFADVLGIPITVAACARDRRARRRDRRRRRRRRCSPISRRACGAMTRDRRALRARPGHGARTTTSATVPIGMLTEAMKPIWARMAARTARP